MTARAAPHPAADPAAVPAADPAAVPAADPAAVPAAVPGPLAGSRTESAGRAARVGWSCRPSLHGWMRERLLPELAGSILIW